MRSTLLIIFGLISWLPAYQQNMDLLQADKLKKELATAQSDSSRALILTQLAEAYRDQYTDTSFYYSQKALELARRINYPSGEAKALCILCYYYFNRGDLPTALELGLKAFSIAKQHNLVYDQACALIRISNAYTNLGDNREAIRYLLLARKITENTEHEFFYAVTFWRAADAYMNLKMIDSSFYNAKTAEALAQKMDNKFIQFGVAPVLGTAYSEKGNDTLALKYLLKNKGAHGSLALANFHKKHKAYDSANYYAQRAYEIAVKNRAKRAELNATSLLANLFEESDPRKALYFQKIAMTVRDSLYSSEKIMAATAVAIKEKEQESKLMLAQTEYRNKIKIYIILLGLVGVILVALVLYRNNLKERKTNMLLLEQKNEIAKTLADLKKAQSQLVQSEKMASLGELTAGIAHEIQNPLNFVNNFSEVNTELIDEASQEIDKGNISEVKIILHHIRENEQKIVHHGKRADAIVKSMLQHSRTSSGKKELTDLNALCDEYLRLAYHGLRAKDKSFNAKFESNLDPTLPKVNIVPQDIGRVILNLINNAFYAVSERLRHFEELSAQPDTKYEPAVTVSTKNLGDKIDISIKDNGNGIPDTIKDKIFQPFFTTKPTGQGTGLGLSLSYDIITRGHDGKLMVETKEGTGSIFSVQLPVG